MAFNIKMQFCRGTTAAWENTEYILKEGEGGLEILSTNPVTYKLKIGDGIRAWTALPYFAGGITGGVSGNVATVGSDGSVVDGGVSLTDLADKDYVTGAIATGLEGLPMPEVLNLESLLPDITAGATHAYHYKIESMDVTSSGYAGEAWCQSGGSTWIKFYDHMLVLNDDDFFLGSSGWEISSDYTALILSSTSAYADFVGAAVASGGSAYTDVASSALSSGYASAAASVASGASAYTNATSSALTSAYTEAISSAISILPDSDQIDDAISSALTDFTLPDATTTVKGKTRYATAEEASAGSAVSAALTPDGGKLYADAAIATVSAALSSGYASAAAVVASGASAYTDAASSSVLSGASAYTNTVSSNLTSVITSTVADVYAVISALNEEDAFSQMSSIENDLIFVYS